MNVGITTNTALLINGIQVLYMVDVFDDEFNEAIGLSFPLCTSHANIASRVIEANTCEMGYNPSIL
jgi:hypothetical protein